MVQSLVIMLRRMPWAIATVWMLSVLLSACAPSTNSEWQDGSYSASPSHVAMLGPSLLGPSNSIGP